VHINKLQGANLLALISSFFARGAKGLPGLWLISANFTIKTDTGSATIFVRKLASVAASTANLRGAHLKMTSRTMNAAGHTPFVMILSRRA
jgi:hypothetical protein